VRTPARADIDEADALIDRWTAPQFCELKMDAEIGSPQEQAGPRAFVGAGTIGGGGCPYPTTSSNDARRD
jgi:hypothetical protein